MPARFVGLHTLERVVVAEGLVEAFPTEGLVQLVSKLPTTATRHDPPILYPLGHPPKRWDVPQSLLLSPTPNRMSLFVRLVRAQLTFGVIFASYMVQLALAKIFRRWRHDPVTNHEEPVLPAWLIRRQARVDDKNSRRMLGGVLRLRGVYIKLGQVLSIMGGFLPAVYIKRLETLQDAVPPHPIDEIEQAFVDSLGARPEAFFRDIDREPVAAASLGQVHVAYMDDGRKVAVKVLYPGIRDIVRIDMRVIGLMVRVYKWFVPVQNIEAVHESLVDLLRRETDYLHEAECMRRMSANFAADDHILFPEVIADVTTRDVLTMTFMEGIKITHIDEIRERGVDLHKLAERLVKSFYKQVFVDRFFHADPHPGNFLVQPVEGSDDAKLVVLDFGAISEVDNKTVFGMVDVLRGFFEQNDALALQGIEAIGVRGGRGRPRAARANGEDILPEATQARGTHPRRAHESQPKRARGARRSRGRATRASDADALVPLPRWLVLRRARGGDDVLVGGADSTRRRSVSGRLSVCLAAVEPALGIEPSTFPGRWRAAGGRWLR